MTTTDTPRFRPLDSDRLRPIRSPASASRSPAAPPVSGWRSSASCLSRGAHVAFVARSRDAVARVAAEHPDAHGIVGDVSKNKDIYPIAMQILGALGGLDVLVNNASDLGPVPLALLADTDCEDFERALATNVLGPFRLTKALLGSLASSAREGSGAVVLNVSSDAAIHAYPRWGAYGASKAALHHMSRIWNEELHGRGHLRSVARSRRHGYTAARGRGARRGSVGAEAPRDGGPRARRRDRRRALAACGARRAVAGGQSMIAASVPVQRPSDAKLLVADRDGRLEHWPRSEFVRCCFRPEIW